MRTLLRGLAFVALVAAVGFLWARYGLERTAAPPPALDRSASVANLSVSIPSAWHVLPAGADPPLREQLTLAPAAPAHARLLIGTVPSVDPGTLPAPIRGTLQSVPAPALVNLGALTFYRYLNARSTGYHASESIYTLPTTAGTVTAVCSSPGRSLALESECERVLATLRLRAGSILSLRPEPGYAFALSRIIGQLNTVRAAAGAGLSAHGAAARAKAASALAAAHARAATEARRIGGAGVSAGNPGLVAALSLDAGAYRALARAISGPDASAYQRAQAAVSAAGRALDRAFAQLRRLGYRTR